MCKGGWPRGADLDGQRWGLTVGRIQKLQPGEENDATCKIFYIFKISEFETFHIWCPIDKMGKRFLTDFRPAGGFSGIRAGPSRVGGGRGGSGRFFEISERQRPARSSGRLGIHDFASEILPNPCGRLQSLLILLNFLDFLLNSLIFHDYSLKCSRGAGQEAPTWMVTGGDWRWGGFKSYNQARKITER